MDVTWTGSNELRVEMSEPRLMGTMSMTAPPLLRDTFRAVARQLALSKPLAGTDPRCGS